MKRHILILFLFVVATSAFGQAITTNMTSEQIKSTQSKISKRLGTYPEMFTEWKSESERKVKLERVVVTPAQNRIHLYFNEPLGQITIREDLVSHWEQMVRDTLGNDFSTCRVQLYCKGTPIERFVPNLYRNRLSKDATRQGVHSVSVPLAQNMDRPIFGKGLSYKHIALWASHGRYYDAEKDAWIWQRPPLFGSLEDVNTFEFTYRYLIPMLENAGAVVVSPRERDPNSTEIIIDEADAKILDGHWRTVPGGFGRVKTLTNENPFEKGSHLVTTGGGSVLYPIKATKGDYALYVSYKSGFNMSPAVEYKVTHSGGVTTYRVNQQMGAGWLYLGTHKFDEYSSVTIKSEGAATTDAVRLGGGMGNVERGGKLSGMPRWAEGARYYLQYSGVPSSIYAQDTEKDKKDKDYADDYKSRGDWLNWLKNEKSVPFDAAVAFHTNAGFNDTIFGTLMINTTENHKGKYSDGKSKFAGRDMADIILSQIVSDIRTKYTKQWTRRSLYDKGYRETLAPDVPAVIIELLSHQSLNDMVYALDPQFRFDASRAVYKGILRFLSERYSHPYVVQPLAPVAFTMNVNGDNLTLGWKEQKDQLEPTAVPTYYKVYTRLGDNGFDNGVIVRADKMEIPIVRDGRVRSYRVTALNDGGESFASEVLSACFLPNSTKMAMVVNEFTKLSGPMKVEGGLDFKNFMPYQHDLGIVGLQKDFNPNSEFIDNENPGWGASTTELQTKGIAGNTFDYTMQKGAALLSEGYSYISSSAAGYDKKRSYDKVVTISERLF